MLKSSVKEYYDTKFFDGYIEQKRKLNKPTCLRGMERIKSYFDNSQPTRLSRENLLKDYLTLIDNRKYNYFGTVTSQFSKSETYFRQLLLGNTYIRKHNTTDLPEHILNKILRKQLLYKRQGLPIPSLLELLPKYKAQIEFYQKGNYINEHNVKSNIFDTPYSRYTIKTALEEAGVNSFFGVLEYGKKNGYCHLHFLLHHDDIENVRPRFIKNNKTGKVSKRYITTEKNRLQSFFWQMYQIGFSDLQIIGDLEKTKNYITKYLMKQYQGFGIDRLEPLNEHRKVCVVQGNGFVMHSKGHKDGYCELIYKGSYKDGKEKEIDMPVNRFYDFDLSYLDIHEKQLTLI